MFALTPSLAFPFLTAFTRFSPPPPLHTFLRTTGYRLRPPQPKAHVPRVTSAQSRVIASDQAQPHQAATVLCEKRPGSTPTIVLGGFVPDSTEQVFLVRSFLLRRGSVYYLNYPRSGFSLDLLCAQLDDLVLELHAFHGQRPVLLGVSFGAGLVLEWLRRQRRAHAEDRCAGVVLISPVACTADIVDPSAAKPTTLLGRALKPFLDAHHPVENSALERSRVIFSKMFEAGAHNKASLRSLLSTSELRHLRAAVLDSIKSLSRQGAAERVAALRHFSPLSPWDNPSRPLSLAPALVLFAEKEDAVLTSASPTRNALETALPVFFRTADRKSSAAARARFNTRLSSFTTSSSCLRSRSFTAR